MKLENDAPYKIYQEIDISNIAKRLSELDESIWYADTHRQSFNGQFVGPHRNTRSIILNFCKGEPDLDPKNKGLGMYDNLLLSKENYEKDVHNMKKIIMDEELNRYTDAIVKNLEEEFNGIAGLVLYTKLPANSDIRDHFDSGYYLTIVHRLHIPIITNDNVKFTIGDTTFHMKKGFLYEINNQLNHSVNNSGEEDRIHLIIDIIPKDKLPEDYIIG